MAEGALTKKECNHYRAIWLTIKLSSEVICKFSVKKGTSPDVLKEWWVKEIKLREDKGETIKWPYTKMRKENGNPNTWDISVLCPAILQYGEWDQELSEEEKKSVEALQDIRNSVVHNRDCEIDDWQFDSKCARLIRNYKTLLGDATAQTYIDRLEKEKKRPIRDKEAQKAKKDVESLKRKLKEMTGQQREAMETEMSVFFQVVMSGLGLGLGLLAAGTVISDSSTQGKDEEDEPQSSAGKEIFLSYEDEERFVRRPKRDLEARGFNEPRSSAGKEIFLSYEDEEPFVGKLKGDLEEHDFSVWLGKSDIPPGSNQVKAIGECKALIAVITNKYVHESKYSEEYFCHARRMGKIVLPVVREDVDFSGSEHAMVIGIMSSRSHINYSKFRPKDDYRTSLNELVAALKEEDLGTQQAC